jgi:hypothetical protein
MSTYIVVVDDEPDVEGMFRQHFRRGFAIRPLHHGIRFVGVALEQVKAIPDPSLILNVRHQHARHDWP